MGVIMHKNILYGGGSTIEPNPQESATEQLETLGIDGDVYDVVDANAAREVQETITEAQSRANLADGDDVPTIFGKIKKWFSDLKDLAFIGKDGTSSTKYLRGDGTWQTFPTIPTKTSDLTNDNGFVESSALATVATSGSYNDLSNKPTIPAAQVNSDWNANSGVAEILNKPALATVATSGSYNDLSNKPTIPTVNNGTLTIQKNGTNVQTFSANQSANATANIECATPSDVEGSKTATGNPLTITDASPIKAEQIVFGIEPIQDLHGYDKPWVGGAGKNKLPITLAGLQAINTGGTWNGNVYTFSGMTFTVNTDSDGNFTGLKCVGPSNGCNFYLFNGSSLTIQSGSKFNISAPRNNNTYDCSVMNGDTSIGYISGNVGTTADVTLSDTTVTKIALYFNRNYTDTLTLYPMIRNSADSATFEPPSNISPITGLSEVSGVTCGKNLFNRNDVVTNKVPDVTNNGRLMTQNGTDTTEHFIPLKPSTTYTISGNSRIRFWLYDANGDYLDTYLQDAGQFTTNAQTYFIRVSGNSGWQNNNIQIEKNPSATTYEAFKGDNVTIQLGQTVYGGTLTLNADGSADVYCDTGYNEYDGSSDEDWHFENAAAGKNFWIPEPVFKKPCYGNDLICNMALSTSSAGTERDKVFVSNGGNLNVTFGDTLNISTVADFKTWLASHVLQVAGTIATPFTIHLSPVETLTLLQGINNVWTDGTTLSLTYQPDNAIGQAKGTAQELVDSASTWKLFAESANANIALPTNCKELYICVIYVTGSTSAIMYDFHILPDILTKATSYFRQGDYYTPDYFSRCEIRIRKTSNVYDTRVEHFYMNNTTDRAENTTVKVYYR